MKTAGDLLAFNMKRLRKSRKWTQEKLAEMAGLTLNSIQRAESKIRFPRRANISAIAKALGIEENELFSSDTDEPVPLTREETRELLPPGLPEAMAKVQATTTPGNAGVKEPLRPVTEPSLADIMAELQRLKAQSVVQPTPAAVAEALAALVTADEFEDIALAVKNLTRNRIILQLPDRTAKTGDQL